MDVVNITYGKRGIKVKIGSSISVNITNDRYEEEQYRSKIIDIDDDFVYIDYPVNIKTLKTAFIMTNTAVTIIFTDDRALFRVNTMIVKRIKDPTLALVIPKPKKSDLEKVQRREYVRIKTDVDIAIHSKKENVQPIITVTNDVSGGGASIIIPDSTTFEEEEIITLYMVLHSKEYGYQYLKTDARVIRYVMLHKVPTMSVEFKLEDEREREKIIQYCFDIERERRRKEIQ